MPHCHVDPTHAGVFEKAVTATTPDGLHGACRDFMRLRPRLVSVAYRVVGDTAEAEDIVQEVWVRWQNTDRSRVHAATAFLLRTTVHLAINVNQSARSRREVVGISPQPQAADAQAADPGNAFEQAETVGAALLALLQKLSPTERAVFVLREAFDYTYGEIAVLCGLSQPNARQVVSRARKRLHVESNAPVDSADHHRLVCAFVVAARSGEMGALERLLTADSGQRPQPVGATELPRRHAALGAGTHRHLPVPAAG